MRLPNGLHRFAISQSEERKKREEELLKLRDERIKAITEVMVQSTIPTVVVQIKPRGELPDKPKMVDHEANPPGSRD